VEICLPPGPCGLLHIAIFDGGYQVWPYEYGESFSGDAETITFDDVYLKETEPYEFVVLTWNEDDTYQHWCQVRLGLVSKEIFMGRFLPSIGFSELETIMTNLLKEQERLRSGVSGKPLGWMTAAAPEKAVEAPVKAPEKAVEAPVKAPEEVAPVKKTVTEEILEKALAKK